jgi:hypothetical protein
LIAGLLALAGCSGGDCVELDGDCTPAYPATFANVHQRTLVPSCAVSGASCHATAGAQGGLALENLDDAFSGLVGDGRVLANDAACSLVMQRLSATGSDQMPPGAPLSESQRCAIAKWISEGAQR